MNKLGLIASSLLVAAALVASASASAASAYNFLVSAEGSKTGKFKGESLAKGEEDKIPAVAFSFSVRIPQSNGQASGKRQYSAVTFTKPWGASSPQFLQAAALSEVLKSVKFEFMQTDPLKGTRTAYQTMTLSNALVSGITRRASSAGELEDVSITFQKIELADAAGGAFFSDTPASVQTL
jgi:type VI secretion system secreted protein Hcp